LTGGRVEANCAGERERNGNGPPASRFDRLKAPTGRGRWPGFGRGTVRRL